MDVEPVEDIEQHSGLVDLSGRIKLQFEFDTIACLFHLCCRDLLAVVEFLDECDLHERFFSFYHSQFPA